MIIAATTSLPAVDRPNPDRWNVARSCQLQDIQQERMETIFLKATGLSIQEDQDKHFNFFIGEPRLNI